MMKFNVYKSWHTMPKGVSKQAEHILTEAFPPEECRSLQEIRDLADQGRVQILTAEESDRVLGVVLVWVQDDLVFLENFAVASEMRGRGLGTQILECVWEYWKRTIILEVELPAGEMERRRIQFYERNGFHLSRYPYRMPNLHGNAEPLPLLLMSRPNPLQWQEAREITIRLYDTVYRDKIRPELQEPAEPVEIL